MMRLGLVIFGSAFLGALMSTLVSYGDTNTLLSVSGGVVRTSHVNQYFQAFSQSVVPRNSSGVSTANAGTLGTSTFPWRDATITTGYWGPGDIKCKHTFNNLVPIGQGWMSMDGRQVTQANYDTEHGAGSWATYIGSSPLLNRYLPNMSNGGTGRYIIAKATTPQTGIAGSPTAVGNSNHGRDFSHTHVVPPLNWYTPFTTGGQSDKVRDVTGALNDVLGTAHNSNGGIEYQANCNAANACLSNTSYTESASTQPASNPGLNTSGNIQPESIEFVCYMRII